MYVTTYGFCYILEFKYQAHLTNVCKPPLNLEHLLAFELSFIIQKFYSISMRVCACASTHASIYVCSLMHYVCGIVYGKLFF